MIPENHDLPDAVAFAYRDSILWGPGKHWLAIEKGLDEQVEDSDDQPRLIHGSDRSSDLGSSDFELSMSMLQAESMSKDE